MGTMYSRPAKEDVRRALIDAAATIFIDRGYAATRVEDVAAAADFTKGAVYSNFGGKPELFAAAVADQFRSQTRSLIEVAAQLGARRPELARLLAQQATDSSWGMLLGEFRTVAYYDPKVAAVYDDLVSTHRAELADQLRSIAPELQVEDGFDFDAAALLLTTVIHGIAVEHAVTPDRVTPGVAETVMSRLLEGLLP
jgi:AcrR family transcriptional regulator